jgi:hypothetical protein
MAKSKNNVITHGLSGTIGDMLVFRQRAGETIVAKRPTHIAPASEKQIAQRIRFQQATVYAETALATPELKERYKEEAKKRKGVTAYNVAVADFFHAPDIDTIDLSGYTGTSDDQIRIIATDDFAVQSVHVSINTMDGELVEEGYAENTAGNLWIYKTTAENESLTGTKFVITASDIPGNIATEEMSL